MRLNKFLAAAGIASRRKCEEIIDAGLVRVNGLRAQKGMDVDPNCDVVEYRGEAVAPVAEKIYIKLNKPLGYISSCHDEKGRQTVLDLIKMDGVRLFPIGRLDYDTEGLLLLTNDGETAHRLTHPKFEVEKVYYTVVKGELTEDEIQRLQTGIRLDGVKTAPLEIEILPGKPGKTTCLIKIHEGRNRQIRRMMEAVGHPVVYLKRESMAGIELEHLQRGAWAYLSPQEKRRIEAL